jgi:hypothetical protein
MNQIKQRVKRCFYLIEEWQNGLLSLSLCICLAAVCVRNLLIIAAINFLPAPPRATQRKVPLHIKHKN